MYLFLSFEKIVTVPPKAINDGAVSPIGEAVHKLPAIVAWERICEDPNLLSISAKGEKYFSKHCNVSSKVKAAPI